MKPILLLSLLSSAAMLSCNAEVKPTATPAASAPTTAPALTATSQAPATPAVPASSTPASAEPTNLAAAEPVAPPAPAAPAAPATPAPAAPEAPAATPATPAPAAAPAATSAPAATNAPAGEVTKLALGVLPLVMKFDKASLEAKAGAKVMLLFRNEKCALQHNFLLVNPGKLNDIGALADKMLTDPQAMAKHYTPTSPEILAHSTKLIGVGQSDLIEFTAPTTPGDYPYLCTFPGHWRLMNGVLKVLP